MKNLKRALSFALATVMLIGMMVVGASAASFNDVADIENIDAVNTLVALGIIKGKDTGDFDPAGTVTRAEMAKMICVALNGGKDPNFVGTGLYADTKGHWAAGYIDYCTNMGIVAGDTAGNFNPDKAVTGTEAAKMLLIALGFNAETEGFVNNTSWALNIDRRATEKELYEDVATLPAAALSRDNAAQMIFNALQASKVRYQISGIIDGTSVSSAYDTYETILDKNFDVQEYEAVMTDVDYDAEKKEYTYEIGGTSGVDFTTAADYSDLFAMNVKVLYKVKNSKVVVYGIFAEDSVVLGEGLVGGITIADEKVKFAGTTYKYDFSIAGSTVAKSDIPAIAYISGAATNVASAQASAEVKLIDLDGNGKLDYVVYKPFTVEKVTYVGKDKFTAGTNQNFDDVTVIDKFAKDDFVKITAGANTVDGKPAYELVDAVIEGKVTNTKNSGADVMIDGTWYKSNGTGVALKNEYKNLAVVNGYLFKGETKVAGVKADEYAVVIGIESTASGLNTKRQAKLLLTTGEQIVVNVVDATSVAKDALVTFSEDDNVYTLTPVSGKGAFDGVAANTYADNKIDGKVIADDAVVFIKGTTSTKVITGAELKKTDSITVTNAYYNENKTTGFGTIVMAYVSGSISTASDNLYGYLTAGVAEALDSNDKPVYTLTMGDVTLTTKTDMASAVSGLAKGDLVVYKTNEKGLISSIKKIIAADAIETGISASKTAVKAYDGEKIAFKDDSNEYKIDKDTVIMFIDSEDKAVIEDGVISIADKDEFGAYVDNVYAATKVSGTTKTVLLLVVDVNNKMA